MSTSTQRYPALNEYNEAVQHPQTAFNDAVLKKGNVEKTGFGLPRALGGGFAITYTIDSGNKKFAVRCFHKAAPDLEQKYRRISSALSVDRSGYFVGFEYESNGVLVNGTRFPIVKMDWAEGKTLGAWLENNIRNRNKLTELRQQFQSLETYLRTKSYAHGDLQNGNVIVDGNAKLIDYDGFYVPGLSVGQGAELGHKHFQHPARSFSDFGPQMDRFSFIVIDLSLCAVIEMPSLFQKYSNGENIIFGASDFKNPSGSGVFQELFSNATFKTSALNFARVCSAPIKDVPTLSDFLAGRNIPANVVVISPPVKGQPSPQSGYIGAFDVIDGLDFASLGGRVGDRIELVGRILEVRKGRTKYGKPYIFLNFGNWRSNQNKINIWSEGLSILTQTPDASWQGKWISVTGLVDPPFRNRRIGYTHLSITITEPNQIRRLDEAEARRRLSASKNASKSSPTGNTAILEELSQPPRTKPISSGGGYRPSIGVSGNQQILTTLRGQTTSQPVTPSGHASTTKVAPNLTRNPLFRLGIVAAIIYLLYLLMKSLATPNPAHNSFNGSYTPSVRESYTPAVRESSTPTVTGSTTADRNARNPAPATTATSRGGDKSQPTAAAPSTPIEASRPSAQQSNPSLVPQVPPQTSPLKTNSDVSSAVEGPAWPPPINILPAPNIMGTAEQSPNTSNSTSTAVGPTNISPAATAASHADDADHLDGPIIGAWTEAKNQDCSTPLTITPRKAANTAGECAFASVQQSAGSAWKIRALCVVKDKKWTANITLAVNANHLTWTSERGTTVYVRCNGN
jgi:hypothetical protein